MARMKSFTRQGGGIEPTISPDGRRSSCPSPENITPLIGFGLGNNRYMRAVRLLGMNFTWLTWNEGCIQLRLRSASGRPPFRGTARRAKWGRAAEGPGLLYNEGRSAAVQILEGAPRP